MNTLKEKLEQASEKALQMGDYRSLAELAKAIAAIHSADAQQRTAVNIEKALTAFVGAGEAMKQAAGQIDPAALLHMLEREKNGH